MSCAGRTWRCAESCKRELLQGGGQGAVRRVSVEPVGRHAAQRGGLSMYELLKGANTTKPP